MISGGAPGPAAFAGSNLTAAEKRAHGYGVPPVYTPADGMQCNAWAFCASPLGCTAGSPGAGQALTPQVGERSMPKLAHDTAALMYFRWDVRAAQQATTLLWS